ncbi:dethiobiotin synthetase [Biostraticola tofi]|uniref:ATP-dependent dethiobiotin synthetase BioD n=1 Tax=Biostraticola tofi TaxID=466109 RepID=A0A4R3YZF4_9GAMM|nr:dethiobiotin synthetase [Biostraticola tofi]
MALFIVTDRYFITGTDTDAGKTVATCALLQSARRQGGMTVGYKPVASGCIATPQGWRNSDALALAANSSLTLPYDQINPLAFGEPTSPHIASRDENRPIHASMLSAGLRRLESKADWVFVEGAGGWFTPLSDSLSFAQWVTQEQLPVILVVGLKLGCINHALLTALAVKQAGLPLAGWIANNLSEKVHRPTEYLDTLRQRLEAPLLGVIPWLQDPGNDTLAEYLDVSLLK